MQKNRSNLGRGVGALHASGIVTSEDDGLAVMPDNTGRDLHGKINEDPGWQHADEDEATASRDETTLASEQSPYSKQEPRANRAQYSDHLDSVIGRFPTPADVVDRDGLRVDDIPLSRLRPMKNQPRQSFVDETLEELATSIRTYGILQPIIASDNDDGTYTIIAGERRFRAATLAGLTTAPVIVRAPNEHSDLELALIENIQREELNPVDEARALQRLVQEHSFTQETLSSRIGKDRASISNMLRLLTLPEEILRELKDKKLTVGHAKALCALESRKAQLKVRDMILTRKLSVRQTEEIVKSLKKGKAEPKVLKDHLTPSLRHLCEDLKSSLQMKVRISGASDKGKIEIEYFSLDDLERLSKVLLGDPFASSRLPNG